MSVATTSTTTKARTTTRRSEWPRHPRRRRQRHQPGRVEAALTPLGRRLVLARSGAEALARLLEQRLRADHPRRRDAGDGRLRDRAARSRSRARNRDDADHVRHRPVVAGRRDPPRLRARRVRLLDQADPRRGAAREGERVHPAAGAHDRAARKGRWSCARARRGRTSASSRCSASGSRPKRSSTRCSSSPKRSPQGRVPRDPRARAAQPAAAAADRGRADRADARQAGARRACAQSSSARSITSAGSSTICSTSRGFRPASSSCAASSRPRHDRRRSDVGRGAPPAEIASAIADDHRGRRPTADRYGDPVRLVQMVCESAVERDQVHAAGRRDHASSGDATASCAFMRVTDNGRGISPEHAAEHLRHVRAGARRAATAPAGSGSGWGSRKRLVELHRRRRCTADERRAGHRRDIRAALAARGARRRSPSGAARGRSSSPAKAAARRRRRRCRRSARARRRSAAHEGPRGR